MVPTRTFTCVAGSVACAAMKHDLAALGLRVSAGTKRSRQGHDLRSWYISRLVEDGALGDVMRRTTHASTGDVAAVSMGSDLPRGQQAQRPRHRREGAGARYGGQYGRASCSESLAKSGDLNGVRTRVTDVKGRCPRPLDDEAICETEKLRDPNEIRTHVTDVKGRCPGPLDDGVFFFLVALSEPRRIRTFDPRLKRPVLYRLSYGPLGATLCSNRAGKARRGRMISEMLES